MPFGLDPRKLVKEKEEQEKENEKGVVWEAIAKDIDAEEKEKALRKTYGKNKTQIQGRGNSYIIYGRYCFFIAYIFLGNYHH